MTFRNAVSDALKHDASGIDVLLDPNRFFGYMADVLEDTMVEFKVMNNMVRSPSQFGEFLRMHHKAATSGGDVAAAIQSAQIMSAEYLRHEFAIDERASQVLANGLAAGISDFLGIPYSGSVPTSMGSMPTQNVVIPQHDDPRPTRAAGTPSSGMTQSTQAYGAQAAGSAYNGAPATQPQQQSSKSKTMVPILIVACIALIAAIGFLATTGGGQGGASTAKSSSPVTQNDDNQAAIDAFIDSAKGLADNDDYESAYNTITSALEEYPGNDELEQLQSQYKSTCDEIDDILDRSASNASSGNYESALAIIDEGLGRFPSSVKLKTARTDVTVQQLESSSTEPESTYTQTETTPTESAAVTTPTESTPTQAAFPTYWSGTYGGVKKNNNGGWDPVDRGAQFELNETNGTVDGIMYGDDSTGNASYRVRGTYDRSSGYIRLEGYEWINHGGLQDMRNFEGTVDLESGTISGTSHSQKDKVDGSWYLSAQ